MKTGEAEFLLAGDEILRGVGQNDDLKDPARRMEVQAARDGGDVGKGLDGVFITDRYDDGGSRVVRQRRVGNPGVTSTRRGEKTVDNDGDTPCQPGSVDREKSHTDDIKPDQPVGEGNGCAEHPGKNGDGKAKGKRKDASRAYHVGSFLHDCGSRPER